MYPGTFRDKLKVGVVTKGADLLPYRFHPERHKLFYPPPSR